MKKMSEEYKNLIEETIVANQKSSDFFIKINLKLKQKLMRLIQLERGSANDLGKALIAAGLLDVDPDKLIKDEEEPLLKFFRDDSLVIYVPMRKTKLLQAIGNVGEYIGKLGRYIGFYFDNFTDPRYPFPEEIVEDVKKVLPQGFENDLQISDGVLTFPPEHKEKVKQKYGKYLKSIYETTASIKDKRFFDFQLDLSSNGFYLYNSGPYPKEIIRKLDSLSKIDMGPAVEVQTKHGIELRDFTYQQDILDEILYYRHATLATKTGSGKTLITLAIFRLLAGPKLVMVDSKDSRTQWLEDIALWVPEINHEIHVFTYQTLDRATEGSKNELHHLLNKTDLFSIIVYDEGERAFNWSWGKSLAQKSVGRLFVTATPKPRNVTDLAERRTLFGKMFATDWRSTMEAQKKSFATVRFNILKNNHEKMARLMDRVNHRKKTHQLVYAKWVTPRSEIITGSQIARKLSTLLKKKFTFIHGKTKGDRLALLRSKLAEDKLVVTTVAGRSVSLKQLQSVHLFEPLASETLPVQQIGRFGHSDQLDKVADVYFTRAEVKKPEAQKWIYYLISKGYPVEWPDGEPKFDKQTTLITEISDSVITSAKKTLTATKKSSTKKTKVPSSPSRSSDEFFDRPIIIEAIQEMFEVIEQVPLTEKVLAQFILKDTWTTKELVEKIPKSQNNISKALRNLKRHHLILTVQTSQHKLNFDAERQILEQKTADEKIKSVTEKFKKKQKA